MREKKYPEQRASLCCSTSSSDKVYAWSLIPLSHFPSIPASCHSKRRRPRFFVFYGFTVRRVSGKEISVVRNILKCQRRLVDLSGINIAFTRSWHLSFFLDLSWCNIFLWHTEHFATTKNIIFAIITVNSLTYYKKNNNKIAVNERLFYEKFDDFFIIRLYDTDRFWFT